MANAVCDSLAAAGHWADYTDPASGYPVCPWAARRRAARSTPRPPPHPVPLQHQARGERGASIYPDVLGAQMFLKYDVISANCCSILSHPLFGTKVRASAGRSG